ncbi:hypothetical protein BPNPMPFG_008210 (plasmid) [Mesorhizobium sp. AR07]|uniref:hypothetical protein n=1 Tax=Mesorhizobium sp. AR07 TaxID=2865838 RepID=UPI00215F1B93|nr:hypothetical protein [Mesorhizobium sp. AR07]UVK49544.1 hypothetical protein BPNPMPFG_008210 [Mesorhizobium sp. AR07]
MLKDTDVEDGFDEILLQPGLSREMKASLALTIKASMLRRGLSIEEASEAVGI